MRLTIRRVITIVALLLACGIPPAWAQKTVHVKGYTKKDGTVVKPHDRKAPGSSTPATYPPPPSSAPSPVLAEAVQQAPPGDQPSLSMVFVVAGGPATALYHRALCPWLKVSGAVLASYSPAEAEKRYFQPHCLCIVGEEGVPPCSARAASTSARAVPTPPVLLAEAPARSDTRAARSALATAPAYATETVYVTKTGDKYHRAGCRYLSKSAIPTALKDAVSGHTPCSVCRPPTLGR
jgi:hypothetical protein